MTILPKAKAKSNPSRQSANMTPSSQLTPLHPRTTTTTTTTITTPSAKPSTKPKSNMPFYEAPASLDALKTSAQHMAHLLTRAAYAYPRLAPAAANKEMRPFVRPCTLLSTATHLSTLELRLAALRKGIILSSVPMTDVHAASQAIVAEIGRLRQLVMSCTPYHHTGVLIRDMNSGFDDLDEKARQVAAACCTEKEEEEEEEVEEQDLFGKSGKLSDEVDGEKEQQETLESVLAYMRS